MAVSFAMSPTPLLLPPLLALRLQHRLMDLFRAAAAGRCHMPLTSFEFRLALQLRGALPGRNVGARLVADPLNRVAHRGHRSGLVRYALSQKTGGLTVQIKLMAHARLRAHHMKMIQEPVFKAVDRSSEPSPLTTEQPTQRPDD